MTNESDALDLNQRVLCSDGTCIGVIGDDGKCKECGKYYDPHAKELAQQSSPSVTVEDLIPASSWSESSDDVNLADRVLCSDGACIGTIGSDGKCKECGKSLGDQDGFR